MIAARFRRLRERRAARRRARAQIAWTLAYIRDHYGDGTPHARPGKT